MSGEVIMLAKHGFTPDKLEFPVPLYPKLDGVAADFYVDNGKVVGRTRQGEPLKSVQHICDWLEGKLKPGRHVIGELYIPGKSFKDIGGLARREYASPELLLMVYDFYREGNEEEEFRLRLAAAAVEILQYSVIDIKQGKLPPVRTIPCIGLAKDAEEVEEMAARTMKMNPKMEGVVIRTFTGKHSGYTPGKRSWGLQTIKQQATEDLVVVGFEEAIDKKTKQGNGMVGRINVQYKDAVIGVGPGKLTLADRKAIWEAQDAYIGKVAEVAYKPDPEYTALREPRFYRWRDDKTA